jgi:hypothetical protein
MIRNLSITAGGVAQDLLPANLGRSRLIIEPITEDCWVNFGSTAAVDSGEKIVNGTSSVFTVEKFPEIGGRVSVFSATTGAKIIVREA